MFAVYWSVIAFLGLIVLGHVLAWLIYVPVVARVFGETPWLPAPWREPLEEGETVEVRTHDGIYLEGTYLAAKAARRKGVVAFCHELNGNRWASIPYTENLREQGYDIFTFDFRNHGNSYRTPGYEPLPWVTEYDLSDLRAVTDYLCSREDADPRGIGLIGVSKGGTVALCASAKDDRIRTLVVDGACPTERMQLFYIRRFAKIFARVNNLLMLLPDTSLRMTSALARVLLGRRRNCRFVTVDYAAKRIHQPVLMIHGRRDAHIPLEVVQSLRNSMPTRPDLWITPRAKHNESIEQERPEYHRRIAEFFDAHLATVPVRTIASRRSALLARWPRRTKRPVEVAIS